MSDLFAEELEALRARSLDRHLREIWLLLWKRISLMREPFASVDYWTFTCCSTLNAQRPRLNEASSAIFPLIVGDEQVAMDLASALQSEGFLVPAIRYPTVARGSARLRITVTASHDERQIRSLCEAIRRNCTSD